MNEVLAAIYGTGGFEKIASPYSGEPLTLHDLALALVVDENEVGEDIEKVASAHNEVFENLLEFDRAGRAMAHHEFAQMEKMAHEGDPSAIEAFFADAEPELNEREEARQAVLAEIERRYGQ